MQTKMKITQQLSGLALAVLLLGFTSGCAAFKSCEGDACTPDQKITADVREQFVAHRELGAPAGLHVQTIHGVVYLSGIVDSDLERRNAEAIALTVANVKDVVNNLATRNDGR
jgi:osmotically-inducible protein OsmY